MPKAQTEISKTTPIPAAPEPRSPAPKAPIKASTPVPKARKRSVPAPKKKVRPDRPRKELKIPPILLEGDATPAPEVGGPGARYALAAQPVSSRFPTTGGELPQSYGTGRLFLAARDPHWLYASWDFDDEQQRKCNAASKDGHLVLRVLAENEPSPVVPEVHVHPESRNWFVHVPRAATAYHAELGYYTAARAWFSVATSRSTFTPPDAPSPDISTEFATIPAEITFQQVVDMVQGFVTENQPLLESVMRANEAAQQASSSADTPAEPPQSHSGSLSQAESAKADEGLRAVASTGMPQIPVDEPHPILNGSNKHAAEQIDSPRLKADRLSPLPITIQPGRPWTPQQRHALTRLINIDSQRRVWMGSIEITELVRRQLQEEIASIAAAELAQQPPGPAGLPAAALGISSPMPLPPSVPGRGRNFWFKVNAELIIYGATEPDAHVTVADRPVKLRPDGTFTFRFSLPDGRYQLPAIAISADREDGRQARLEFSRSTDYRGHVEVHPQDPALRPPHPESIR